MKITKKKLEEMVTKIVKAKLDENFMQYGAATLADLDPNEMGQVKQWLHAGGDVEMPPELMHKLTYMYVDEMPVDVQQGNSGTPEEWLFQKLDPILAESKTSVKISPKQLKEMIRKMVSAEMLAEAKKDSLASSDKMPEKWVQYMKDVEDLLAGVVEDAKKLHEEGEELKTEEREQAKVANPVNAARGNHYEYIDERSTALKSLVADLGQKLEIWKTKYEG